MVYHKYWKPCVSVVAVVVVVAAALINQSFHPNT